MTPDIDFQFANTSGLEIGDGKRSMDLTEVDDDVVLRHNNLIEDMYGVQRRTGIPYKRLKADNDTTRKTSMGPISGNTGLGEYMKEDDGEKSSSTAVTPDVVDLTLGKDLGMASIGINGLMCCLNRPDGKQRR
jgi:hypothetical protein